MLQRARKIEYIWWTDMHLRAPLQRQIDIAHHESVVWTERTNVVWVALLLLPDIVFYLMQISMWWTRRQRRKIKRRMKLAQRFAVCVCVRKRIHLHWIILHLVDLMGQNLLHRTCTQYITLSYHLSINRSSFASDVNCNSCCVHWSHNVLWPSYLSIHVKRLMVDSARPIMQLRRKLSRSI